MSYLQSLNPAQLKAVQHSPNIPLQILAGPGSGKTKVLTSRIAYLIQHHSIPASSICAVTFTNKAANEMRERLTKLIGKEETTRIKLGTFHSLCATFLRMHSNLVGLEENFTVCDADESKKIISKLLKRHRSELDDKNISLRDVTVLSLISKAKSKGLSLREYIEAVNAPEKPLPDDVKATVATVYEDYTKTLQKSNSLDFDDLLCFGVKLFGNKKVVHWCRHVLVDEFQDTNNTQYELMRCMAAPKKSVTIVGDPDQSIYGWRSAEVANLSRMCKDFPNTVQMKLEHNYRSTKSILAVSSAIVVQDKKRISKSLYSSHPAGPAPLLKSFSSDRNEAAFLAAEIKRVVACMGGMLTLNDFVILLRFNALSRTFENALQKEGIQSRLLGGHKFFERSEIKDLLAYLQLVDNPHFVPAFTRIINIPPRGIGEKTVEAVLARARDTNMSPLLVVDQIYDGKIHDINPPIKTRAKTFMEPIRKLTKLAEQKVSPSNLITTLLELIDYETYLKKSQEDWENRWENVQELLTFAKEVENRLFNQEAGLSNEGEMDDYWIDGERELEVDETEAFGVDLVTQVDQTTPLRAFLQESMLSTDTESQDGVASREKVTISTCHAAKGLEWPVVMIPAVEEGIFPSLRAEDVEEERAQGILYVTHSVNRMVAGEWKSKGVSPFISTVCKTNLNLFSSDPPEFTADDRTSMASVCGRDVPDEKEVVKRVDEFAKTHKPISFSSSFSAEVPRRVPYQAVFKRTLSLLAGKDEPFLGRTHNVKPPPAIAKPLIPSHVIDTPTALDQVTSLPMSKAPISVQKKAFLSSMSVNSSHPQSQPSPNSLENTVTVPSAGGLKRRLGMGRGPVGHFPNKKFKTPI